jgi:hypothetical protein
MPNHILIPELIPGNLHKYGRNKKVVDVIFRLGRMEGFTDIEISQLIRNWMNEQHYSPITVRKYLHKSTKNRTKAHAGPSLE